MAGPISAPLSVTIYDADAMLSIQPPLHTSALGVQAKQSDSTCNARYSQLQACILLAADCITNCLIACGLQICIWLAGPLQYGWAAALRYRLGIVRHDYSCLSSFHSFVLSFFLSFLPLFLSLIFDSFLHSLFFRSSFEPFSSINYSFSFASTLSFFLPSFLSFFPSSLSFSHF